MTIQIPSSGKVVFGGQSKVVMRPSVTPMTAVGGATTDVTVDSITYRTHTFTSTGILTVTSATDNIATVEYLVVGGGGGGGTSTRAGGGGAGGYRTGNISLNVGDYTIAVGAGGTSNTVGENSSIGYSPTGPYILISDGGGYGGNQAAPGGAGGSGGGGGSGNNPLAPAGTAGSGTPGQGFPGGGGWTNAGAGGGGGGAGGAGSPYVTATGGIGVYNSISGGPILYAQGGQGGSSSAGPSNSGFGGGGNGSSGGSGIVIIRYRIT